MLLMFLDLTVVYFAFGAPVGVYQIARTRRRSARSAAVAFLHFALWPLAAAASLSRAVVPERRTRERLLEEKADVIRREIENVVSDSQWLLEFRDAFARYTGLAIALIGTRGERAANELFAVAGQKNEELAARCLDRRNRRRLEFHLLQARNEFADMISAMAATHPDGDTIAELGNRLANVIDSSEA